MRDVMMDDQEQDRDRTAFQTKVLTALGDLKAGQAVTNVRLDGIDVKLMTLNGSVARHEKDLNYLKFDSQSHKAVEQALEKSRNRTYSRYIHPAVKVGAAILTALVLEHISDIAKMIKP